MACTAIFPSFLLFKAYAQGSGEQKEKGGFRSKPDFQAILRTQRAWQCQVCKQKTGCGYEVTAEMLPAVSTVSYDTGILKELLYVDIPSEHQNVSGEIVVHYDKATVELVYQNLRIVHNGPLCIVFTPDLKVIYDLLVRSSGHLELREDPQNGIIVAGLRSIKVGLRCPSLLSNSGHDLQLYDGCRELILN